MTHICYGPKKTFIFPMVLGVPKGDSNTFWAPQPSPSGKDRASYIELLWLRSIVPPSKENMSKDSALAELELTWPALARPGPPRCWGLWKKKAQKNTVKHDVPFTQKLKTAEFPPCSFQNRNKSWVLQTWSPTKVFRSFSLVVLVSRGA